MSDDFINLTVDNLESEHLCCIIRTKKQHPSVEAKREWLASRLTEGHVFRKLNAKATVFIEYAPLEKAWVPVVGEGFLYIYCLWVNGDAKGHGYGKALMQYCIEDARRSKKSGICMLGAASQKAWLSDQAFAKAFGFAPVERTESGYELLSLSFDGTNPRFTQNAKAEKIADKKLTLFYSPQCPYTLQTVNNIKSYCQNNGIAADFILIDSLEKAKSLPCVFNNFAVFYNGNFQTVNMLDPVSLNRILNKEKR